MDIYHTAAYFLIYSFLGWGLEIAYHAVCQGKIVNRGFLNGPVCPIYGFGMLSVIVLLVPLSDNLALLFFGGLLFATVIELFGGWVLYRLFHMRWWDYTNEPFNLGGYICVKFSLAWGICIVGVIRLIHPLIALNVYILDNLVGYILVAVFFVIYAVDTVATVLTVAHLNKELSRLNEMAQDMRKVSDALTDKIANQSLDANAKVQSALIQATLGRYELEDKLEEVGDSIGDRIDDSKASFKARKEQLSDRIDQGLDKIKEKMDLSDEIQESKEQLQAKLEQLQAKRDQLQKKLSSGNIVGYGRIYRAFPQIKHELYNDELRKLVDKLKK